MRLHRFYVSQPLGEEVVIENVSIIKQWLRVFKYTQGDFVILFNGDGNDYTYSIKSLTYEIGSLTQVNKSPSFIPAKKVTLYISLIKKDNFELVVQKVTELGVTTIVPIISERSEKKNLNEDRLSKISIEASEQCGRGDIPEISSIITLKEVLKTFSNKGLSIALQMGGLSFNDPTLREKIQNSDSVNIFVGPEGGWSPDEEAHFATHAIISASLGGTVLRAETAAIVASALVMPSN